MREIPRKTRTKQRYTSHLKIIEKNPDCDLQLTKGVKLYCPFNELKYFHVLDNFSIDIMHDVYEGVVPFFLKRFFSILVSSNILNFNRIQAKIRDFDYGTLNKSSHPSDIKLKRHNLGQCATQTYTLIVHIPFIFAEFKCKIPSLWKAMEYLLQILQIIHSVCISEDDIRRLQSCIEKYLSYLTEECQVKLTPKHHNLTHYPTVIRKMGPLIHMWMMRMESKHKSFTDMVKRTNNYKNLPKTLALQHQESVCIQNDLCTLQSNLTYSKTTYNIARSEYFDNYKSYIPPLLEGGILYGIKFIKYGSYEYRSGLMIMNNDNFFEIVYIFQYQNKTSMLCHPYSSLGFEPCYISLEIKKDCTFSTTRLFDFDEIENKKSYEKITKFDKTYIFADTLDVFNKF